MVEIFFELRLLFIPLEFAQWMNFRVACINYCLKTSRMACYFVLLDSTLRELISHILSTFTFFSKSYAAFANQVYYNCFSQTKWKLTSDTETSLYLLATRKKALMFLNYLFFYYILQTRIKQ